MLYYNIKQITSRKPKHMANLLTFYHQPILFIQGQACHIGYEIITTKYYMVRFELTTLSENHWTRRLSLVGSAVALMLLLFSCYVAVVVASSAVVFVLVIVFDPFVVGVIIVTVFSCCCCSCCCFYVSMVYKFVKQFYVDVLALFYCTKYCPLGEIRQKNENYENKVFL